MPRPAKGARLYLRKYKDGRASVYVILDGKTEISTGFGVESIGSAEGRLKEYLAEKRDSTLGKHEPAKVRVDDVLLFWAESKKPASDADARAHRS